MSDRIRMTWEDWTAEAVRRFGPDPLKWRFECPACHHVASVEDYKNAGCAENVVAFSCIGRWLPRRTGAFAGKGGPCDYAGGGLFRLNPVIVVKDGNETEVFAFAQALEPLATLPENVTPAGPQTKNEEDLRLPPSGGDSAASAEGL